MLEREHLFSGAKLHAMSKEDIATYADLLCGTTTETTLSFEDTNVSRATEAVLMLAKAFSNRSIVTINLRNCQLHKLSATDITALFAGILARMGTGLTLDISDNLLGSSHKQYYEETLLPSLFHLCVNLNVSNTRLHQVSPNKLIEALQEVPHTSLRSLNLSHNDLASISEEELPSEKLEELLAGMHATSVDIAHNGFLTEEASEGTHSPGFPYSHGI